MKTSAEPRVSDATRIPEAVQWRHVALFTFLAYALSWTWWAPRVLPHLGEILRHGYADAIGPADHDKQANVAWGMFGPLLAAVFMRLWISREGLRGSIGLLRSWRLYTVALITPMIFTAALLLIQDMSGLHRFIWHMHQPLLVMFVLQGLVNGPFYIFMGLGEEYGWRGYLLRHLLPLGESRATFLVGLIWGLWHLPPLLLGAEYPGKSALIGAPLFLLFAVLLAFPFTWLYRVAGYSSAVVALMHTTFNAYDPFTTPANEFFNPLITGSVGIVSKGLLFAVVLVFYLYWRRPLLLRWAELFADNQH